MSRVAAQRREVRYRGDVQGVGFRYTARRIASGYDLSGFVRNRSDGSVQLVVEGTPKEIELFLQELADTMRFFIHEAAVQELPATGEFAEFSVRH